MAICNPRRELPPETEPAKMSPDTAKCAPGGAKLPLVELLLQKKGGKILGFDD